jgi:hypothetical protein
MNDPWAAPQTPGQQPPADQWRPPPGWQVPVQPGSGQATNSWAIVALVTGVLPLFPVAIGAGITALVQIGKRRERGTGLAVAGLVLGGLWMLVIAGLVVWGLNSAFDYREGPVARVGVTTVGSCVQLPDGDGPGRPVDCASAHDAEVYGVRELGDGDRWPGAGDVDDEAYSFCDSSFKPYTGEGYLSSDYDYGYYTPDKQEWASGEHRVVCVILPYEFEGPLRGSARKSR